MVTSTALANVFDHFDRNLFTPYAVGFDRVFDRLQDYASHQVQSTGFPPYNIRKDGDYNFVIEIALAGLSKDDLEVEVAEGVLTVRTKEKKDEDRKNKENWGEGHIHYTSSKLPIALLWRHLLVF